MDDFEREHQKEAFREKKQKTHAAVNLQQFQNHVVGQGYQAKHVIRQKSAVAGGISIQDMTKKPSEKKKADIDSYDTSQTGESYLNHAGLRAFRKEIENILSS